ncbi:MAG: hypothetical protein ABFR89_04735 [Actinomycetota bacterium]
MDLEQLNREIAGFHRGKKWILLPDAAAGATPVVERLREWGAGGIMVVAAIEGVGDLPEADRFHYTRTTGDTVMKGIRAYLDSVERPSADLIAAVDAFDPEGDALVLGDGFSRESINAGRRVYGARPVEWGALEDKTTIDRLWDDAGVRRAPSAVVPVEHAADTAAELASGLGTVWVADNREGWHGGGEYARWVRDPEHVEAAQQWLAEHADTVRVMPFLDGIPCSIHGFNTRDGVAVFLPVEMVILRHADKPEFVYAQAANFWNPPDAVRDEMRSAARSVGALLADRHGYLGGFGIDGVCTQDGFFPTELNPRTSVGHGLQSRTAEVPLGSIQRMLTEGDLDIGAVDLEETIVTAVEANRAGGMLLPLTATHEPAKTGVRFDDGSAVAVDADGENDGTMEIGSAAMGSIIIMKLDSDRMPIGPSVAPRAIQAIDLARELWGIDVPPLVPAPDVCRRVERQE